MKQARNNDSIDPAEVLKTLFEIDSDQIEGDLALARDDVSSFRLKERSFRRQSEVGLDDLVASIHRRLLIASQLFKTSLLPADLILFSSTQMAHEVAEMSCAVASGRGQLAEFAQIFEGRGYESYFEDSMVESSDKLLEQIHDLVEVEIFKRYGLQRYAVLFEENRPLYEIRFEIGRRLVVPDLVCESEHRKILAQYQENYCPDIVREFLRRLGKHDLLPA